MGPQEGAGFRCSSGGQPAKGPVNATIGLEQLAALTGKPSNCLHRMLSPAGDASMENLASIFQVMRECLNVQLQARSATA